MQKSFRTYFVLHAERIECVDTMCSITYGSIPFQKADWYNGREYLKGEPKESNVFPWKPPPTFNIIRRIYGISRLALCSERLLLIKTSNCDASTITQIDGTEMMFFRNLRIVFRRWLCIRACRQEKRFRHFQHFSFS